MNQAIDSWGRATYVAADDDYTHLWDSVCSADVFFYTYAGYIYCDGVP